MQVVVAGWGSLGGFQLVFEATLCEVVFVGLILQGGIGGALVQTVRWILQPLAAAAASFGEEIASSLAWSPPGGSVATAATSPPAAAPAANLSSP